MLIYEHKKYGKGAGMNKEKEDEEDLRKELGLSIERADELVRIVSTIMDKESPDGERGRTSHVLLNIVGRKDLNDVEKVACVFLFSCRTMGKNRPEQPRICPSHGTISLGSLGPDIKMKEFIDIEGGISGMVVAPEGIDPSEMAGVIMATLMSILRQMSKPEAQNFCIQAGLLFSKMGLSGDIRL